jgi:hypothetical protein
LERFGLAPRAQGLTGFYARHADQNRTDAAGRLKVKYHKLRIFGERT